MLAGGEGLAHAVAAVNLSFLTERHLDKVGRA